MNTKYTSVNFVSNDFLARIAILRLSNALLGLGITLHGLGNALHGLGIAIPEPSNALHGLGIAIPRPCSALPRVGIALPEPCIAISPLSIAIQSAKRAVPDAKSRIAEGDFVSFLSKFAFSSRKWRRRVGCK